MKKPSTIQFSIPRPCQQHWEDMLPVDNGRFCAQCQRTVTDFSTWTDQQLHQYFTQPAATPGCGRFLASQLHRPIQLPPQPASRLYRYFIGLGLTLVFAQLPAAAKVWPNTLPPGLEQPEAVDAPEPARDSSARLVRGTVLEGTHQPAVGADVVLLCHARTMAATITDSAGHFSLAVPATAAVEELQLQVAFLGYKDKPVQLSAVNFSQPFIFQLPVTSAKPVAMGDFVYLLPNPRPVPAGADTARVRRSGSSNRSR